MRVLVENGVGTPGLVEKARAKLVDAGFRFLNGGNASSFGDDPSTVLVADGTTRAWPAAAGWPTRSACRPSAVLPNARGQTSPT